MTALVRARDFEMERIMRECESAISSSGKEDGLSANEEQLCRLNDRVRVSSNCVVLFTSSAFSII